MKANEIINLFKKETAKEEAASQDAPETQPQQQQQQEEINFSHVLGTCAKIMIILNQVRNFIENEDYDLIGRLLEEIRTRIEKLITLLDKEEGLKRILQRFLGDVVYAIEQWTNDNDSGGEYVSVQLDSV
ncbi:MAG: hypothetical protein N2254_09740 [bacterium]|nr:hypothetical protein [bacterium]